MVGQPRGRGPVAVWLALNKLRACGMMYSADARPYGSSARCGEEDDFVARIRAIRPRR